MSKRKDDLAAAKAKKQRTILIVGGVLLLAVAVIQGPKLLKSGSSSDTGAPATSDSTGATASATPAATPTSTGATALVPVAAAVPTGSASVAGVALPKATVVKVAPSQLASFTLFEVKDPFVQKEGDTLTPEQAASDAFYNENGQAPPLDSSGSGLDTTSTDGTAPIDTSSDSSDGSSTPAAKPAPVAYATITYNGNPQYLQVKGTFPTNTPLFVLRSLKKKSAKIAVAGGSFDDGQTVTLKFGKKVTLVNTATGVRYVLKLVYTGVQPEQVENFTTTAGSTDTTGTTATTPTP